MLVKDIMNTDVVSVTPETTVQDAAMKMRDYNVGSVVVVKDDTVIGLVIDRQIATKAVAGGMDPKETAVKEIMTKRIVTGTPGMDIFDAAKIFGKLKFRRLPIIDKAHHLRGIISIADISRNLKRCIDDVLIEISTPREKRTTKSKESYFVPQWLVQPTPSIKA